MSLADEWDSVPASSVPAASANSSSVADMWDSIRPEEAKTATKAAEPPSIMDRAKLFSDAMGAPYRIAGKMLAGSAANQVSGIGAQIIGGWRGLAALASGAGLDEASRQVHAPELSGGAAAQAYEPEEGTAGAKVIELGQSPINPMTWAGIAAHKAGDVTMDVTGSPAAAAAVETGLNAVPLVLIKGGKEAPARAEPKVVGSGSIADQARPAPARIEQQPNYDVPTVLRRRAEQQPVAARPADMAAATPKAATAPPQTPPEQAAAKAEAEAPEFTEALPTQRTGTLPAEQQASRAAILQRVGLAGSDVRTSALTGDAKAASTDYQTARLDNAAGDRMKGVLDRERAGLTQHAEDIVRSTGGTLGTDESSLIARGQTILSPLEAFKQWFTDQTTALYKEAAQRAQGQPLSLDRFGEVLGTDSKFQNTDTIALRNGIQARMRELGMLDKDGNPMPATVEQAEALRQYVNEEWSPRSNGRIRELKNALDEDVTGAAGDDIYGKARALHAMKQAIFADPKGLSSILDSEGINRKVPIEKIPDTIAALPTAQFAHIVETLRKVPPELQPQAEAALSEIKAQFANRLRDAGTGPNGQPVPGGQWRARDVTTYLKKNATKIQLLFSPEEVGAIRDLNDAGHILAKDASYPGAAVQAHNLVQRGVIAALPKVGAAAGGTLGSIFGPLGTAAGAFVGDAAGSRAAAAMTERAGLKATEKRLTRLGDFPK
jgi:hypothetical protein